MVERKVMVTKKGRFYARIIHRDGAIQKAFKKQIGEKTGACVRKGLKTAKTKEDRQEVFEKCAVKKGTKLTGLGKKAKKK